ncbi:hypothetical protein BZB76_0759 [Actinomadura pelletieri DSM 43383]|uniref:Uncharacterized protein n=1 Tax=Actinomadura pelletieri DSM 43383 TaxID=1120940 RepID=A0A495QYW0_9ACTN|nr:hypothetical protein BZB76_0759 [Actinomadura pelletieri DSM 43383]
MVASTATTRKGGSQCCTRWASATSVETAAFGVAASASAVSNAVGGPAGTSLLQRVVDVAAQTGPRRITAPACAVAAVVRGRAEVGTAMGRALWARRGFRYGLGGGDVLASTCGGRRTAYGASVDHCARMCRCPVVRWRAEIGTAVGRALWARACFRTAWAAGTSMLQRVVGVAPHTGPRWIIAPACAVALSSGGGPKLEPPWAALCGRVAVFVTAWAAGTSLLQRVVDVAAQTGPRWITAIARAVPQTD